MRRTVDPTRHAADDYQSVGGKIDGQPLSHAAAIGSGMARPNNRNPRFGQQSDIAPDKEHDGWIVDLFQSRRVLCVA